MGEYSWRHPTEMLERGQLRSFNWCERTGPMTATGVSSRTFSIWDLLGSNGGGSKSVLPIVKRECDDCFSGDRNSIDLSWIFWRRPASRAVQAEWSRTRKSFDAAEKNEDFRNFAFADTFSCQLLVVREVYYIITLPTSQHRRREKGKRKGKTSNLWQAMLYRASRGKCTCTYSKSKTPCLSPGRRRNLSPFPETLPKYGEVENTKREPSERSDVTLDVPRKASLFFSFLHGQGQNSIAGPKMTLGIRCVFR